MHSKLMSMKEAISGFVHDGDIVVIGAALEHAIPFAAGHEVIREGKRRLTLVGPVSDMLFDQLIGAGCVSRVEAAWVGNVSGGIGYNYRRAVEEGSIEVVPHTNLSIALALHAAALGIPFIPTYSLLGSDIMRGNKAVKEMRCPFTGDRLALVPAINPDVCIVHVQRCDEQGNSHFWGNLGITADAVAASGRVIVSAEEVVDAKTIRSNPNGVVFPGSRVVAVVEEPFGAHPSPLAGYYNRDHRMYADYHEASRTREGFEKWLKEWIIEIKDRREYLNKVDREGLKPKNIVMSEPFRYGF